MRGYSCMEDRKNEKGISFNYNIEGVYKICVNSIHTIQDQSWCRWLCSIAYSIIHHYTSVIIDPMLGIKFGKSIIIDTIRSIIPMKTLKIEMLCNECCYCNDNLLSMHDLDFIPETRQNETMTAN